MSSDFYLEISPNVGDMSRNGEHYLVNRRTGEWVKIDADAYEIIQRCEVMSYKEVIEMALKKYGGLKEDYIALFDILLEKSLVVHKDAIFRQLDERQEISPTLADVYVTRRCNLNCLTCFVDSLPTNGADILDADVIKQLLDKLAKGGCKEVHITGGEPLLRSDIFEILSHARNLFPRVTLSTNGTLINKKSALKLSGLIDSINIGLDGSRSEIHDAIRGQGSFSKTMRGVKNLLSAGYDQIKLIHTETAFNIDDISAMEKLADQLNVKSIVCTLAPLGRAKENIDILWPPYKEAQRISEIGVVLPKMGLRCDVLVKKISVYYNGDLYPCDFLFYDEFKLGSLVKSQNLMDILDNNKALIRKILNRNVDSIPGCKKCDVRYLCKGGCMAYSFSLKGNIRSKTPLCKLHKRAAENLLW